MSQLNPAGMCMCGCGEPAPIAKRSNRTYGHVKGEPVRYIREHIGRNPKPEYEIDENGCWIWQHSIDPQWGYGCKRYEGRNRGAHVVYYIRHYGPVPEGHDVHHRCTVPACVNPAHLVALTRREHMAVEGRRAYGNPHAPVRSAA